MSASRSVWPLSHLDSFFLAYQEHSQVLMSLGGEVELEGALSEAQLQVVLDALVHRFPPLAMTVEKRWAGLAWKPHESASLLHREACESRLDSWRNRPIDPFREPPFRIVWIPTGNRHKLLFCAHHAVLDGEGFLQIMRQALLMLARELSGHSPPKMPAVQPVGWAGLAPSFDSRGRKRWKAMIRYTRWLSREAGRQRSARLAIRSCEPGGIAVAVVALEGDAFQTVLRRASRARVSPSWIAAAAWARTLRDWNRTRASDGSSLISLEIPVSLRSRFSQPAPLLGNRVSPLTIFLDPSATLEETAREAKGEFWRQVRAGSHLGVPILGLPGRFLPWGLFRRVAVNSSSTGFATSHFTWLAAEDLPQEIRCESKGKLRLVEQQVFTPICLHMGTALLCLRFEDRLQCFLGYRLSAFDPEDARGLADRLKYELLTEQADRSYVTRE